ncbi:unnamed protein product [Polarella glacialis]|uniref:Caspase family p20 domain-containing protein n=2 Tax=Polarella glacialis TaxID=89957 RepID=A0A813E9D7_POLGL|nr:unnamed protein product [Polarella glacialis]
MPGQQPPRRMALILANGAYTRRAPLSKPVGVAAELRGKLEAMGFAVAGADDQGLAGMRAATKAWLQEVESAAEAISEEEPPRSSNRSEPPLVLLFVFAGHGSAGRFFPVDCPRPAAPEDSFCFFEDLLFRLLEALGGKQLFATRPSWQRSGGPLGNDNSPSELTWHFPGIRIIMVIESCRRLSGEELSAYEAERTRITHGRRHLLPCLTAMRPDLAALGGAEWDAARLAFLSRLGPGAPQMLLALSSESTSPSYDVVFLRSIVEGVDKPVRLGGILERASLETLRRTGHKQKPVLLPLGGSRSEDFVAVQDIAQLERSAPRAAALGFQRQAPLSATSGDTRETCSCHEGPVCAGPCAGSWSLCGSFFFFPSATGPEDSVARTPSLSPLIAGSSLHHDSGASLGASEDCRAQLGSRQMPGFTVALVLAKGSHHKVMIKKLLRRFPFGCLATGIKRRLAWGEPAADFGLGFAVHGHRGPRTLNANIRMVVGFLSWMHREDLERRGVSLATILAGQWLFKGSVSQAAGMGKGGKGKGGGGLGLRVIMRDPAVQNAIRERIELLVHDKSRSKELVRLIGRPADVLLSRQSKDLVAKVEDVEDVWGQERNTYKMRSPDALLDLICLQRYCRMYGLAMVKVDRGSFRLEKVDDQANPFLELLEILDEFRAYCLSIPPVGAAAAIVTLPVLCAVCSAVHASPHQESSRQ